MAMLEIDLSGTWTSVNKTVAHAMPTPKLYNGGSEMTLVWIGI